MAESKGLTVSPTDEHEANDRDEPAESEAGTETEAETEAAVTPDEETPEPSGPVTYRMRRAPRYRAFGLTGLVIGVILGAVLAVSSPASGDYSSQTILATSSPFLPSWERFSAPERRFCWIVAS